MTKGTKVSRYRNRDSGNALLKKMTLYIVMMLLVSWMNWNRMYTNLKSG